MSELPLAELVAEVLAELLQLRIDLVGARAGNGLDYQALPVEVEFDRVAQARSFERLHDSFTALEPRDPVEEFIARVLGECDRPPQRLDERHWLEVNA